MRMAHLIDLDDKLSFGKYSGNSLEWVLYENFKYVDWCQRKGFLKLKPKAQEVLNNNFHNEAEEMSEYFDPPH
jgi:hypothetical protein